MITEEQQSFISDQLSNCYDLMSEQEMIDWFVDNGIDRKLSQTIVSSEFQNFCVNPIYEIDWKLVEVSTFIK
jgi:hypothetical protein